MKYSKDDKGVNKMVVENSSNIVVLKVSGTTALHALKTAVVQYLVSNKVVYLDCIGVAPNYLATKAVINVRAHLTTIGARLNADPIFHDICIDDGRIKTGIRWILKKKDNN